MSEAMEELTASYFLRAWHESSPKALDTVSKHMHDVQACSAAPWNWMVGYFEVSLKNARGVGGIYVGFSTNSGQHPGCGDGEIVHQTVAIGDTLGCGVNYVTKQFIYTKNGVVIGSTRKNVEGPVFPAVCFYSENEEVTLNFGETPFLFDLKAYIADHQARLQKNIDEMEIARGDCFRLVRSYLHHYGYEETLGLFDMDVETEAFVQEKGFNEEDGQHALSQRKMIRQMIMCGQVDDAITILEELFPQIMKNELSPIRFFLRSQKFVELVRDDKLSEAIVLGRNEFDKFRSVLKVEDQVQDCASLLVYELPHESCVGYLLEESHRELVADLVNATILSTNPNMEDEQLCTQSSLERLIRQLTACFLERKNLNMYQG